MAFIKNYTIERGNPFQRQFRFKRNGVAENITGWLIRYTLKINLTDADADAVVLKDFSVHTDPAGGISICEMISEAENQTLLGKYYYDVKVTPTANPKFTMMKGIKTFVLM